MAEGALAVARERCIELRRAQDEVYKARAPVAELQRIAAGNKTVRWFLEKLSAAPAVPGAEDLPMAAQIVSEVLALPVKRTRGRLAEENVRAELLLYVFQADPDFPDSATEWAHFEIAYKLASPIADGDKFRANRPQRWASAIARARKTARKKPIQSGARAKMRQDLRDEAMFLSRRAVAQ